MNFYNYLKFKYKISNTANTKKNSRIDLYAQRIAFVILISFLTLILYFVIKLFPHNIQVNMNKYTLGLYAFLCLISFSSSVKQYYKEYFLSIEREILIIAPIQKSQIILSRFFVVTLETMILTGCFLTPFVIANFFAGNLEFNIVLATMIQIISVSLFCSSLTHIFFALAFLISKGHGLKTVAYTLMTIFAVAVIGLIIFSNNYKSYFIAQNSTTKYILYGVVKYSDFLILNHADASDVLIFILLIIFYSLVITAIAFYLTKRCYRKGLLSISSRELKKSFYARKVSLFINKYIQNYFLKKDILYLIRSPKMFSIYITPILFTSVIEIRNKFVSSEHLLPIFITVFALVITSISLSLVQSDDLNHKDLLFTIPFDLESLYRIRSRYLYLISTGIAGIYLVIVFLTESLRWEYFLFGVLELMILTYINSKVMLRRVFQKSNYKSHGYRYNGSLAFIIFTHFLIWNVPLIISFSLIYEIINLTLLQNHLSNRSIFILITLLIIIFIMLYNSKKTYVSKKGD
ncbi:elicitor-associated permease-like protein [Bacillus velezensis]|uniref:elicitor-associated permease-like protein n=1 Tax=Bacillus velezensis TaxID=492670 RepID=UPI001F1D0C38|nr:elicitor-associated permease-like protein [Bacillus velezensis]UJA35754.1 hypothetical protein L0961_18630 [Bacillus velezensis]